MARLWRVLFLPRFIMKWLQSRWNTVLFSLDPDGSSWFMTIALHRRRGHTVLLENYIIFVSINYSQAISKHAWFNVVDSDLWDVSGAEKKSKKQKNKKRKKGCLEWREINECFEKSFTFLRFSHQFHSTVISIRFSSWIHHRLTWMAAFVFPVEYGLLYSIWRGTFCL